MAEKKEDIKQENTEAVVAKNVVPTKNSMLLDVKYVKQRKKEGIPDYLYIVWRDIPSGEKFMKVIPEPRMPIYFEKEKFRNHSYNKNYAPLNTLEKEVVKYKDIPFVIANDIGEEGRTYLQNQMKNGNYNAIREMFLYPYVFGADYDVATWYRIQWLLNFDNDLPKKLKKGFLDIEVDGLEVGGMPTPRNCPVNAVTLIDDSANTVYTFLLMYRKFKPKYEKVDYEKKLISEDQIEAEKKREEMYAHMHSEQKFLSEHTELLDKKLHEMFDDSYGSLNYNFYYYEDEKKMLVHLFQLINQLKLDIIGIWNMSFDIPYLMQRMDTLGLDPCAIISHPDFPSKECFFKADERNHDIKNKHDNFYCTSYTTYYDQMELYASIRKSKQELRSYRLTVIAQIELKDSKLDYSDNADIKTLPYVDFEKFVIYNIKDVLLQMGIERRTSDFDALYSKSYLNATAYPSVFSQTVVLRNVQYKYFLEEGLVPGSNVNVFNDSMKEIAAKYDKEDDEEDDEDDSFEGALVADPRYNDYEGIEIYGQKSNCFFENGIDFDMTAFYPSSIFAMNIDPSTLIFKMIIPTTEYDIGGGEIPLRGITKESFTEIPDVSKELMDNFITGNFLDFGAKWLNLPSLDELYELTKE